jgi:outer membrane biosynthesis protein TonB
MLRNRFKQQGIKARSEPGLGRMFLASLGGHLVIVVLFSGLLFPHFHKDLRPVYYVDLVNLPAKDPQAGHPDARPAKTKPQKKVPKPAPVKKEVREKKVESPKPAEKTVKKRASKPVSKPKPASKPKAVTKTREPVPSKGSYEKETLGAIENLRRKKEIEELKNRLAALSASDTRQSSVAANAPLGMPEGKGTEAGNSKDVGIQAQLKKNWSLSKYQVVRQDLEANVLLTYDAQGNLIDYKFREKSGDLTFDESVKKAILKTKELPFVLGSRYMINVVFNLKDLLE